MNERVQHQSDFAARRIEPCSLTGFTVTPNLLSQLSESAPLEHRQNVVTSVSGINKGFHPPGCRKPDRELLLARLRIDAQLNGISFSVDSFNGFPSPEALNLWNSFEPDLA